MSYASLRRPETVVHKKLNPELAAKRRSTISTNDRREIDLRQVQQYPSPQPKLKIGARDDVYEREANLVADQLMRIPDSLVQRTCMSFDEKVRRKEVKEDGLPRDKQLGGPASELLPDAQFRIETRQGPGQPLPAPLRSFFEPRFGIDFGIVRVHTDLVARRTASEMQARAFTLGSHIWLGRGESLDNRHLMAHELTHVVQQGSPSSDGSPQAGEVRGPALQPNRGVVQRLASPAAPPRRPTPTGRRSDEATPKNFYEIRSAIYGFMTTTIRPEDMKELSNEQLRSLDFACEFAIEVAGRFAAAQAEGRNWSPPAGYPDEVYKNTREELEKFRRDQVLARRPYDARLATENFFAEKGGDTPLTSALWDAAMPKVKELVWRMELGTAERTATSLMAFLSDREITEHAFLTRDVWRKACKQPVVPDAGIDPENIRKAVKTESAVISVRLALAAVTGAQLVSEKDRKDPSDAAKDLVYNVIQARMESELANIDQSTTTTLNHIYNQQITGGLTASHAHENSFWRLLWNDPRGSEWKALQHYREWADKGNVG